MAYEQWRSSVFPPPVCWDLDLGAHTAQLAEYAELGFDKIFLHHVGQEQDAFVAAFGEKVLPQLRSAS